MTAGGLQAEMTHAIPDVCHVHLTSRVGGGQQVYEREISAALSRHGTAVYHLEVSPWSAGRTQGRRRVPLRAANRSPYGLARVFGALTYRGCGLIHRMDLRCPPGALPEVVTVHDLAPLRFSDEGSLPRSARRSLEQAAAIVCGSNFAARELEDLWNIREAVVIPYAASSVFATPDEKDPAAPPRCEAPFILHVGGTTERKNLRNLAGAWREVSARRGHIELLMCGPPGPDRESHFGPLPRCRYLGHLPDSRMRQLMAAAVAVVVPSVYEGFGLPVLEAFACGTPVVAAARSALPEVSGDAALLVEPDPASLADGLLRIIDDVGLGAALRQRGLRRAAAWSWDDAAERLLAVYAGVLR